MQVVYSILLLLCLFNVGLYGSLTLAEPYGHSAGIPHLPMLLVCIHLAAQLLRVIFRNFFSRKVHPC